MYISQGGSDGIEREVSEGVDAGPEKYKSQTGLILHLDAGQPTDDYLPLASNTRLCPCKTHPERQTSFSVSC